jgi:tRNA-Thr(GGU) m(6)t(6)A37 methyltransferase TsaA
MEKLSTAFLQFSILNFQFSIVAGLIPTISSGKGILMQMIYKPIGIIHTPFKKIDGMPIQPSGAAGVTGTVEVLQEYQNGLADLDGFSHIILVYHFHAAGGFSLTVTPFLDSRPRGLFATRAPKRPNPIGLSVVRLVRIETASLFVENIDVLDQTPLLDIKPYVPEFDHVPADRIGWFEKTAQEARTKRADDRFK